jgi:hypothetical protein
MESYNPLVMHVSYCVYSVMCSSLTFSYTLLLHSSLTLFSYTLLFSSPLLSLCSRGYELLKVKEESFNRVANSEHIC